MKKTMIVGALIAFSVSAHAERLATILEIDGESLSAEKLASTIDPRQIKAVKQQTLLADGLFHFDKSDLRNLTHNDAIFRDLAAEAKANGYTIRIDAFADELGKDGYNQRLSERRALTVSRYFQNYGVPASQIVHQGWGERYPIVNCRITPKLMRDKVSRKQIIECLAPNRRVTISLLN